MYLSFYGLREKPFNPTPDPRFLFFSPAHREAMAQLEYGVRERRGFLLLTGEIGTGKTTLLRALLDRLDENTASAYVFESTLRFDEILEYIMEDFGISVSGTSRAQRLFALNHFLTDRVRRGLNTVLIIDEAQNLDVRSLERVRLLSNFETTTEKLLQILLVGQPELKDKLNLPELRQLKQRIGLRCRIQPLTAEETGDYIRHRLDVAKDPISIVAAMVHSGLFTKAAVERICGYSQGIPRVVNVLCDHCLLIGYADQKRRIDPTIVEEAIEYLEEGERPKPRGSRVALTHSLSRILERLRRLASRWFSAAWSWRSRRIAPQST
jgi:general secretion pathway protein A